MQLTLFALDERERLPRLWPLVSPVDRDRDARPNPQAQVSKALRTRPAQNPRHQAKAKSSELTLIAPTDLG